MKKLTKKTLSIALALALGLMLVPISVPATASMSNFSKTRAYSSGQFTDVNENQWYGFDQQKVIATAYEHGLMNGTGAATFNPTGSITVAEVVTLAARVNNIYGGGSGEFAQGSPWHQVYVDYAVANGIIAEGDFASYARAATRAEMAYVFSKSMPSEQFAPQNTVNSLPDVSSSTSHSESILVLYLAGIVTGSDSSGTFNPGSNITRAEAAAIISRVILPEMRTSGRTYGGTADGGGAAPEIASIVEFGGIEWRVLDVQDGKVLLLSDKVLNFDFYNGRGDNETWETCTLRTYLNGEFYNNFTAADRGRIAETRVVNNDNPWYGTPGGNDTTDRVFLLSLEEVVRYFGDSGQFENRASDRESMIFDHYNEARKAYTNATPLGDPAGAASWWLRSPGHYFRYAAYVAEFGWLLVGGTNKSTVGVGVRPALWLNLESGIF